jgi:hypothetical protein
LAKGERLDDKVISHRRRPRDGTKVVRSIGQAEVGA